MIKIGAILCDYLGAIGYFEKFRCSKKNIDLCLANAERRPIQELTDADRFIEALGLDVSTDIFDQVSCP